MRVNIAFLTAWELSSTLLLVAPEFNHCVEPRVSSAASLHLHPTSQPDCVDPRLPSPLELIRKSPQFHILSAASSRASPILFGLCRDLRSSTLIRLPSLRSKSLAASVPL